MFPTTLFEIRADGDVSHPYWLAGVDERGELVLEPGEQALTWFSGVVAIRAHDGGGRVSLPGCQVTVTDRRTVWLTKEFTHGQTAWGFGLLGAATAAAITAGSHYRAHRARSAKTLVGQVRHEWVAAATGIYQSRNGLDLATVADGEALVIVTLIPDDPRWLTKEVSRWWAGTIARHRLTVANPLDDQDKGVLTRAACADPSAWDERTDGESSRHICMLPGVSAETNLAAHRASGATARGGSTST